MRHDQRHIAPNGVVVEGAVEPGLGRAEHLAGELLHLALLQRLGWGTVRRPDLHFADQAARGTFAQHASSALERMLPTHLYQDALLEGLRLRLRHGLHQVPHICAKHSASLYRGCEEPWEVLRLNLAVNACVVDAQGLGRDTPGRDVGSPQAATNQGHRDGKEEKEEDTQRGPLALLAAHHDGVQRDGHLHLCGPIRIAVLLIVPPGALVCERGIRLGDLLEKNGGHGVVPVLVRVMLQGLLTIGLLDLPHVRTGPNAQYRVGIKAAKRRRRVLESPEHAEQAAPKNDRQDQLDPQAAA
mmetsp:Transcript_94457/g.209838  ORF Transcript_94457/g.209838 Transcript_94457/m.209838 type:complete len:299 (-) Transcript_94457:323-1219(-)